VADVSDDGSVTAFDASLILQYVSGSIEVFPAELKKGSSYTHPLGSLSFEIIEEMPGEETTLAIRVEKVHSVSAFAFEIEYDQQMLQMTNIQKSELAEEMTMVHNVQGNAGKAFIAMAGAGDIHEDGAILYITFSHRKEGTSQLEFMMNKAVANETDIYREPQVISLGGNALGLEEFGGHDGTQLYPNPSSGIIHMAYTVETGTQQVGLSLYDALGNKLADLIYEKQRAGDYTRTFDLKEQADLPEGIYYLRLTIGSKTNVHKLIVQ